MNGPFLDTNVLVYAYSDDPRKDRAIELIEKGGTISVQSLAEFAHVARRKLGQSATTIAELIANLLEVLSVEGCVTLPILNAAMQLSERYKLSIHDSTLLAVALNSGCDEFLSEDLQNGLVIENRLTVRNPFLSI